MAAEPHTGLSITPQEARATIPYMSECLRGMGTEGFASERNTNLRKEFLEYAHRFEEKSGYRVTVARLNDKAPHFLVFSNPARGHTNISMDDMAGLILSGAEPHTPARDISGLPQWHARDFLPSGTTATLNVTGFPISELPQARDGAGPINVTLATPHPHDEADRLFAELRKSMDRVNNKNAGNIERAAAQSDMFRIAREIEAATQSTMSHHVEGDTDKILFSRPATGHLDLEPEQMHMVATGRKPYSYPQQFLPRVPSSSLLLPPEEYAALRQTLQHDLAELAEAHRLDRLAHPDGWITDQAISKRYTDARIRANASLERFDPRYSIYHSPELGIGNMWEKEPNLNVLQFAERHGLASEKLAESFRVAASATAAAAPAVARVSSDAAHTATAAAPAPLAPRASRMPRDVAALLGESQEIEAALNTALNSTNADAMVAASRRLHDFRQRFEARTGLQVADVEHGGKLTLSFHNGDQTFTRGQVANRIVSGAITLNPIAITPPLPATAQAHTAPVVEEAPFATYTAAELGAASTRPPAAAPAAAPIPPSIPLADPAAAVNPFARTEIDEEIPFFRRGADSAAPVVDASVSNLDPLTPPPPPPPKALPRDIRRMVEESHEIEEALNTARTADEFSAAYGRLQDLNQRFSARTGIRVSDVAEEGRIGLAFHNGSEALTRLQAEHVIARSVDSAVIPHTPHIETLPPLPRAQVNGRLQRELEELAAAHHDYVHNYSTAASKRFSTARAQVEATLEHVNRNLYVSTYPNLAIEGGKEGRQGLTQFAKSQGIKTKKLSRAIAKNHGISVVSPSTPAAEAKLLIEAAEPRALSSLASKSSRRSLRIDVDALVAELDGPEGKTAVEKHLYCAAKAREFERDTGVKPHYNLHEGPASLRFTFKDGEELTLAELNPRLKSTLERRCSWVVRDRGTDVVLKEADAASRAATRAAVEATLPEVRGLRRLIPKRIRVALAKPSLALNIAPAPPVDLEAVLHEVIGISGQINQDLRDRQAITSTIPRLTREATALDHSIAVTAYENMLAPVNQKLASLGFMAQTVPDPKRSGQQLLEFVNTKTGQAFSLSEVRHELKLSAPFRTPTPAAHTPAPIRTPRTHTSTSRPSVGRTGSAAAEEASMLSRISGKKLAIGGGVAATIVLLGALIFNGRDRDKKKSAEGSWENRTTSTPLPLEPLQRS